MKNDYSFKFLGLALLAGVILAFINPAEASHGTPNAKTAPATHERSTAATTAP
ncbi:MAG TPA: hypothetical protein VHO24_08630 [Opitutaceae bacterium]|nr:hypothetical protein [Opitutaceae bacterium]